MSDKIDEAFEAWLSGKVRTVGVGDAFLAGVEYQRKLDLDVVEAVIDEWEVAHGRQGGGLIFGSTWRERIATRITGAAEPEVESKS